MKHKASIITAAGALIAGVIFIVCNTSITGKALILTAGILFIAAAILNLAATLTLRGTNGARRSRGLGYALAWVVSIASLAFGVSIIIFDSTFIPLIPLVLGSLVLLGALVLLYVMAIGVRPQILPAWLYIPALLIVVAAILIYRQDVPADEAITMIYTGSALCLYGVTSFLIFGILARRDRAAREGHEKKEASETEVTPKALDDKE